MTDMPPELRELRMEWENSLIPLVVSMNERKDTCLVVCQYSYGNSKDYYCFRYFTLAEKWVCSMDGARVPIDAVFSWLNCPSARSTQPGRYVCPTPACDLK